jgi:TRAP-type C4-dicarboxylate transport system permease large subunit
MFEPPPAANGGGTWSERHGVVERDLVARAIHSPIGVVLFVASRIAEISYEKLARAVLPWLIPLLVVLLMVTLFPPITMFLPTLVMGK